MPSSIDQQITSLLRQQQVIQSQNGVEFIVETKIKTVDSNNGIATAFPMMVQSQPPPQNQASFAHQQPQTPQTDDRIYFMKTFEPQHSPRPEFYQQQQNHQSRQMNIQQSSTHASSLIKIPLLNSRYSDKLEKVDRQSEMRNLQLPYLEQAQTQFSPPQQIKSSLISKGFEIIIHLFKYLLYYKNLISFFY